MCLTGNDFHVPTELIYSPYCKVNSLSFQRGFNLPMPFALVVFRSLSIRILRLAIALPPLQLCIRNYEGIHNTVAPQLAIFYGVKAKYYTDQEGTKVR